MKQSSRKIWIISLFPKIIEEYLSNGVISKGIKNLKLEVNVLNPSSFSDRSFKGVDGHPYGGGPGMVLRVDVLSKVLEEAILPSYGNSKEKVKVIFTSPDGVSWSNKLACDLSKYISCPKLEGYEEDLVFICGRYEGIDQRFIDMYVDLVFSVGDYVLSGGELPVLSIIDSSMRFLPGVLGNEMSYKEDSFEDGYYDCPKWTRPFSFKGKEVPEVLISGNHTEIEKFNISNKRKASDM